MGGYVDIGGWDPPTQEPAYRRVWGLSIDAPTTFFSSPPGSGQGHLGLEPNVTEAVQNIVQH